MRHEKRMNNWFRCLGFRNQKLQPLVVLFSIFVSVPVHSEPQPSTKPNSGKGAGCDCGTVQFHTGVDWNAKEGTVVPVADGGVVTKVEENENAIVYSPTGGYCGRYIVVKHTCQNGHAVYTRYAQLGRLTGNDGKPVHVGVRVNKKDKIGEVGKKGLLHFEVRPINDKTMDKSAAWSQLYAGDLSMDWSKFHPTNPSTFDFDKYCERSSSAK